MKTYVSTNSLSKHSRNQKTSFLPPPTRFQLRAAVHNFYHHPTRYLTQDHPHPNHHLGKAVGNPARYYVARKGGYELLCMAASDAHLRFVYYDISHEPQSHDSLAWAGTPLGERVAKGDLPYPVS